MEEEEINFQEPNLAMKEDDDESEEISERDIVYYQKDDTTNYSRPLKLNKVKKKNLPRLSDDEDPIVDDISMSE